MASLPSMVATTQKNIFGLLEDLRAKTLDLNTQIQETEEKLERCRGAHEMLTELLKRSGGTLEPWMTKEVEVLPYAPVSSSQSYDQTRVSSQPQATPSGYNPEVNSGFQRVVDPSSAGGVITHQAPVASHHPKPDERFNPAMSSSSRPEGETPQSDGQRGILPPHFYSQIKTVMPTIEERSEEEQKTMTEEKRERLRRRVLRNPLKAAQEAEDAFVDGEERSEPPRDAYEGSRRALPPRHPGPPPSSQPPRSPAQSHPSQPQGPRGPLSSDTASALSQLHMS